MYLFKNAFRNIIRSKGKNILIGIIITVVTICTCIGLAIHEAGDNLLKTYKKTNPLAISFNLDMNSLRNADDDTKTNFEGLTVADIIEYSDSNLVKDFYYTLESSISSDDISPIQDNERPTNDENRPNNKMQSMGDFRITAYSNFAYLEDFENGIKKISKGTMVTGSSEDNEIVISKNLADENDINLNDSITFTLPDDGNTTFTFNVVGIYEDTSDNSSSNFMNMNALNSSNQLYANLNSIQKILDATQEDNTKLVATNGLTVKYYLTSNDNLTSFEKEVREKGLSTYYTITTNEEEILQTLKPIQNISTFSMNFLIVIIIIGIVVLSVINFLNIRDRKYEIGVLRAIGMSKVKVTLQLVLEIFFIAVVSLVIGTSIGTLISQPVTNKMLENEISSYKEQSTNIENNFGGGGFERPSQTMSENNSNYKMNRNRNMQPIDYVDSLKVSINLKTIIQLFSISILLTVISGGIASIFINKYNPNRILQDRV